MKMTCFVVVFDRVHEEKRLQKVKNKRRNRRGVGRASGVCDFIYTSIYIYIYRARPELGRRIERFSQESDKENGLCLLPVPMDCLREISSPRAGRTIA